MMSEDDLIKKINESMANDLNNDETNYSEKLDAMEGIVSEVNQYLTRYFLNEMITNPFEMRVILAAQSAMLLKSISEGYFKTIRKIIEHEEDKNDGKQD